MNNSNSSMPSSKDAWYSITGPENDIVLSTRVRLTRNLANFPFPSCFHADDGERVRSLVFDSFSQMENPEQYQSIAVKNLEPLGQRLLIERGVISPEIVSQPMTGVIVRVDGRVSCLVNSVDHLRIASLVPGMDGLSALNLSHFVDEEVQKKLQLAAAVDFGYLTSNIRDVGSGMKVSFLLHLPSVSQAGLAERVFKDIMSDGYVISGFYGSGNDTGSSLGSYYQISNGSSLLGNEQTQIEELTSVVKNIIELERKTREDIADNKPTTIRDSVYRAIAVVKYSRFIGSREGIDLLSKIKWGLDMGLLSGVSDTDLFSLLYRIQSAHLQYVIRTSTLNYEKDVNSDELKIDRLRSLIIQETLANMQLTT